MAEILLLIICAIGGALGGYGLGVSQRRERERAERWMAQFTGAEPTDPPEPQEGRG